MYEIKCAALDATDSCKRHYEIQNVPEVRGAGSAVAAPAVPKLSEIAVDDLTFGDMPGTPTPY